MSWPPHAGGFTAHPAEPLALQRNTINVERERERENPWCEGERERILQMYHVYVHVASLDTVVLVCYTGSEGCLRNTPSVVMERSVRSNSIHMF